MRHSIAGPLGALVLATTLAGVLPAQKPGQAICPATLSTYPVDLRQRELPLRQQARFEIRVCHLGDPAYLPSIQILGFRSNATLPSLFVDTGSQSVEELIQTGTILVVQVTGGDSSPVYIAQFRNGTPVWVSTEDGGGAISYSTYSEHGDYATIKVWQKTFPGPDGKFPQRVHTLRLKIHDE